MTTLASITHLNREPTVLPLLDLTELGNGHSEKFGGTGRGDRILSIRPHHEPLHPPGFFWRDLVTGLARAPSSLISALSSTISSSFFFMLDERLSPARPLHRGRAVHGDWPDGRATGGRQDLQGVSHLNPGEGLLSHDTVSKGYPLPGLRVSPVERYSSSHPPDTPAFESLKPCPTFKFPRRQP